MIEFIYNISNATSITGILQYVSSVSPFSQLSLIATFAVSFLVFLNWGINKAFVTASFISFLTALFFFNMGLLNAMYLSGSLVLLIVSVLFLVLESEKS